VYPKLYVNLIEHLPRMLYAGTAVTVSKCYARKTEDFGAKVGVHRGFALIVYPRFSIVKDGVTGEKEIQG